MSLSGRCRPLLAVGVVLAVAGCTTAGSPRPQQSTSAVTSTRSAPPASTGPGTLSSAAPSSSPVAVPASVRAEQVLAGLTLAQRVGQLLMIGMPAGGDAAPTLATIRTDAVGNVFLSGRDAGGVVQVRSQTAAAQAAAGSAGAGLPHPVPLLIGTDQEGGQVQVLSGPGFDVMPSGVEQGELPPADLQTAATRWGKELAAAGVRVDLGPVLDTVPPGVSGSENPPIAGYDRQFGSDPATVSAHGLAVFHGLAAAGVVATGKHFPGLGRVTENTDTHAGVTDPVTGPDDPYLQPFADAVRAGMAMIMVSSAIYPRIDGSQPAAFSAAVIGGVLRTRLGYAGVVMSDDLGYAVAVQNVAVGERAVRFVAAGGDLVLDVAASQAPTLAGALIAAAQADPTFAAHVDASALRILTLKASLGLLG